MVMQTKQLYPTDLTDSQWYLIKEMLPKAKPGGRPRTLEMREVVNAIISVNGEKTGFGSAFTIHCALVQERKLDAISILP